MNFSTQEPVLVACAADNFFSMSLAVTAFSTFKNLDPQRQLILFILDGGISSTNKKKLLQTLNSNRVDVRWIKPTKDQIKTTLLTCQTSNHPISAYYRLLLPTIIPPQFKKVIYLDSDVVVEGDLAELWDQDLKGQALLAVQDPVHEYIAAAKYFSPLQLEDRGITPEQKYLNSGVLVINLEEWRRQGIANQVLKFIGQHPDLPFPDQDAINIILAGQWSELDPRWNQMHAVHTYKSYQDSPYDESLYKDLIHHPSIIHYTSRPKPWGNNCTHPQADRYFKYLDQTAWSGWRNNVITYNTTLIRRGIRRIKTTTLKLFNRLLPTKLPT
ncbi:glycosyltransferase family 8 protein [Nodosilinea sp. LEGE 06152]|uniref:glycosyltransferase family 8 protein n=1 Tax=Nodosilinea sp. LEGE 06152 TaxID=2777966 RepID=UPI00187E0821|nr:glycosyltransferase family 8 protein [Nodosilinea sp. LEGE 06152]MBE9159052.1 glycosyltransferase family 8 protein [Nodosilinea sp. LEGE 06152]